MPSKKYSLDELDIQKWIKNIVLFSIPCIVAFLGQLQAGKTVAEAIPFLYIAFINALMDLMKKYSDGETLG